MTNPNQSAQFCGSSGFPISSSCIIPWLTTSTISWCSAVPLCCRTLRTEGFPPSPVAQKMPPDGCGSIKLHPMMEQHQGPKLPLLKVLIEISKIPHPLQGQNSHIIQHPQQISPSIFEHPFNFWVSQTGSDPFASVIFWSPKNRTNPSLWPSREICREPCWTRTHGRRTTRIHPEFWDSLGGRWQNDLWIQLCQIKP